MNWKKITFTFLLLFICMLPSKVLAVDFEIEEATIDAYVQVDGTVNVNEVFTYQFNGKFNGITRLLVPKEGATIEQFSAKENSNELVVEENKGLYKIFRKGNNETITIELQYKILNGVEKYEDGVQFYWPFFDKRNESDYKNMTITIHPPEAARQVDFLGYDVAYETGAVHANGTVSFEMGNVPAGKNGDVRVIYESTLFSQLIENEGLIRDVLIDDKNRLATKEMTFLDNQQKTKQYGLIGLTMIFVLFIGIVTRIIFFSKRRKHEAMNGLRHNGLVVPDEKLSMPATIYFTNGKILTPEVTAAALLDLIRKGYVKQTSEEHFILLDRNVMNSHEEALVKLLFDKIGDGVNFHIGDLETYTKNKQNHSSYSNSLSSWRNGIVNEVKQSGMYENKPGIRWYFASLGIILGIAIIPFIKFELYLFMTIAIVLCLLSILLALFYHPLSLAGQIVIEEWKTLRRNMKHLDLNEWNHLSAEDKYRAYTYGIGVKDEILEDYFTEFGDANRRVTNTNIDTQYYNPTMMTASFYDANKNASVEASGSSSSSSSGGVGGGGGGSGAF